MMLPRRTTIVAAVTSLSILMPIGAASADPDGAACPPAKGRPAPAKSGALSDRLTLEHDADVNQAGGLRLDARSGLRDPDGDARGVRTRTTVSDVDDAGTDSRFAMFDDEDGTSGRAALNVHDVDDVDRDVRLTRLDRSCDNGPTPGPGLPAPLVSGSSGDERQIDEDGSFVFADGQG